jgi:hypothetical protein
VRETLESRFLANPTAQARLRTARNDKIIIFAARLKNRVLTLAKKFRIRASSSARNYTLAAHISSIRV